MPNDCVLYLSEDDIERCWIFDYSDLNFSDVTRIYDCESNLYIATESIVLEKGLIFNAKVKTLTFKGTADTTREHANELRRLLVNFLSTRKEHTVDTGVLGMEGLQENSPLKEILDRIESYAVVVP